jgi:hypothetical protein
MKLLECIGLALAALLIGGALSQGPITQPNTCNADEPIAELLRRTP